jgi:asparagine synthetase B (glutamine-hydrolysing)
VSVVIGGEGADEIFLGSDLFKEHSVRFCMRRPQSVSRRKLLTDLSWFSAGGRAPESRRRGFGGCGAKRSAFLSSASFTSSGIDDFYTPESAASLGG